MNWAERRSKEYTLTALRQPWKTIKLMFFPRIAERKAEKLIEATGMMLNELSVAVFGDEMTVMALNSLMEGESETLINLYVQKELNAVPKWLTRLHETRLKICRKVIDYFVGNVGARVMTSGTNANANIGYCLIVWAEAPGNVEVLFRTFKPEIYQEVENAIEQMRDYHNQITDNPEANETFQKVIGDVLDAIEAQ